jgi:hypothetical protein
MFFLRCAIPAKEICGEFLSWEFGEYTGRTHKFALTARLLTCPRLVC